MFYISNGDAFVKDEQAGVYRRVIPLADGTLQVLDEIYSSRPRNCDVATKQEVFARLKVQIPIESDSSEDSQTI